MLKVSARWIALAVFGLVTFGVAIADLIMCQGHLGYAFDDAYIHLALSERLAHGIYGMKDAAWLDRITRQHQVGLVMIYPEWFRGIPDDWTPVGVLWLKGIRIIAAYNHVAFYVTPEGDVNKVRQQLKGFVTTLPPQAYFENR